MVSREPSPIDAVVAQMQCRLDALPSRLAHQRVFLSTYQRTTQAVGEAVVSGRFEDPGLGGALGCRLRRALPERARRRAVRRPGAPRPWRFAFGASADLPALRHVLLGINAHVNYDLPQALLQVITTTTSRTSLSWRVGGATTNASTRCSVSRVADEGDALAGPDGLSLFDRLMLPLNRLGSRRFLREARQKVWHNTVELHDARVQVLMPTTASGRARGARRCEDRRPAPTGAGDPAPALTGFGVTLPPA